MEFMDSLMELRTGLLQEFREWSRLEGRDYEMGWRIIRGALIPELTLDVYADAEGPRLGEVAMSQLKARDATLIKEFYVHGEGYAYLQELLDVEYNTAHRYLSRAKGRLFRIVSGMVR